MPSVNKVILIGHLGRDPESWQLPSGDAVCNFSIATSEHWKDKASGERKEATEWHRISAFGRLADVCEEFLRKGMAVYIEGSLRTRKWQDKDGNERQTTEIRATEMKMLSRRGEAGEPDAAEPARAPKKPARAPKKPAGGFEDMGDDIPF